MDADALDAADDPVADGERAEQAAARARWVRSTVDHDDRVHALAGDAHPAAAHAHLRRVDRRAVEVAGGHAGPGDRLEPRVAVLLRDAGAHLDESGEDRFQALRRRRHHAHPGERRLVVAEACLEGLDLEAAAAFRDAVEQRVHETGVEEIALDLDHPLADGGGSTRRRRGPARPRVRQLEHEALRGAAGEDELRERAHHRLEAPAGEALLESRAREIRHVRVSDHHGVAGEVERVGGIHLAALLGGHADTDGLERVVVEGVRIVDDAATGQRAEARVEVVEPLVDQPERNHLDVEQLREVAVCLQRRAHAVAAPEERDARLEEGVALALERAAARQRHHPVAALPEPGREPRHLGLALRKAEACRDERAVVDEPRVGGERHVGEPLGRLGVLDGGPTGELRPQPLPLLRRDGPVGAADVALHPRVDHVGDAVEPRRAHEKVRRHSAIMRPWQLAPQP